MWVKPDYRPWGSYFERDLKRPIDLEKCRLMDVHMENKITDAYQSMKEHRMKINLNIEDD